MKAKIIEALKTKYSSLGFSSKAIDGVAESLAATGLITDENLDAVVEGQKSALSAMQAEIDSRVTSAVEKAKANKTNATPANGGEQQKNEPGNPFDPEAMKAELLKTLREEQAAAMLQTQQAAQRAATIASKLNIAQDADLDEYFKSARQELADAGFELSEAPAQGGGIPNSGDDIAKLINKGTEDIVKHQNK